MDEPTSALTEREVEHLFTIIRALRAQGIGIIYITHKMSELFEIADEFSVFRDGKYIATKFSNEVTRDEIIRMMVGREITQMFPKETVPIGDVVLSVEGPRAQGHLSRRLIRCALGRNPGHCRSGRLGALEHRGDDFRRHAGRRGNHRTLRQEGAGRQPGDRHAPWHGVSYRGPQGHRLLPAAGYPGEYADRRAAVEICQERLRRAEAARPRRHGNQQCARG